MSAYQLPLWVWPTALLGVGALAVLRGRDQERMATVGLLAAWAFSMVVFRQRSQETQWAILGIDLALFLLYVWMALGSRRFWPLFVAGFQLLALVTHLARALDPGISGWAYLTAERIWSYLVLITIGYGAWTAPYCADTEAEPNDVPGATRR